MGTEVSLKPLVRRRRLQASAVVALVAAVGVPSPASADLAAFVGACVFDVKVTSNPPVDLTPDATTLGLSAEGACVVNELSTWGAFSGVARTPLTTAWSCLGGVARGTGTLLTGHPSFSSATVELVLINSGGVLTMTAYIPGVFTGSGTFAPNANTAQACAAGQARAVSNYTGPFGFEDPTLS